MLAALIMILFLPTTARAACTIPAGEESQTIYDFTDHTLKLCTGTNWVSLGTGGGGGSSTTTSSATWNAATAPPNATLSLGNQKFAATNYGSTNFKKVFATQTTGATGKYYYEVQALTQAGIGNNLSAGFDATTNSPGEYASTTLSLEASYSISGGSIANGDTIMLAIDVGAGKFWYGKNGAWAASGNPATGANPASTFTAGTTYYPALYTTISSNNANASAGLARFSQSAWAYSAPTGFGMISPASELPAISSITQASAVNTLDNTNYAQTWNWSTATTQNPMTLTANALTTGSLLSLTSSSASINSTNGLLYVANTGAGTTGTVARIASSSAAGSGLTVLASGNVGVGTSAPTRKLEIYDNASISNSVTQAQSYVRNALASPSGHAATMLDKGATGATAAFGFLSAGVAQWDAGISGDNNFHFRDASSAYAKVFNIEQGAGANALNIKAGGNIGIGTTNPTSLLQVGSTTYQADSRIRIAAGNGTQARTFSIGVPYGNADVSSPNYDLVFRDETMGADRMTIDYATGNVGIGTTTPAAKLHVADPSASNDAAAYVQRWFIGSDGTLGPLALLVGGVPSATGSARYAFISAGDSAALRPLVLNYNGAGSYGNVGIGSTAAPYKLTLASGTAAWTGGGNYLGFCVDTGCLPGYPSSAYPTIKTDATYIYFSSNGAYSGYVSSAGFNNVSSRTLKENFEEVDYDMILGKIAALPVMKWNYKSDKPDVKHIGPFAEDWHEAFRLNGEDNKSISDSDRGGIALAAIKGLILRVTALEAANDNLAAENATLRDALDELRGRVDRLEGQR